MEYTVGVAGMDIALSRLIGNRIAAVKKNQDGIRVLGDEGSYVRLALENSESLLALADILADIITENLQIRFIMRCIENDYEFVSQKDQCEILIDTLKRIWYRNDKGDLEYVRRDVSSRIAHCLFESSSHIISLDGVLRFRMKDCIACWRQTLEQCVDDFLAKNEREEFIRILRYYACMRDPGVPYVRIVPGEDEYLLFDAGSTPISMALPQGAAEDTRGVTKEDMLLSRLINLSPEEINVAAIEDDELRWLIAQVFIGRIRK